MQSEVISLGACTRELIPVIDLVDEVGAAVGMTPAELVSLHVTVHEDNAGALVLAAAVPPQCTTASKHYAFKTHWFQKRCQELKIVMKKVSTFEQLGDIFTKCVPRAQFEYLRKKLMGW